jgi:methylated-DNA-[protein]-cysteine S-methyltransferase
MSTEPQLFCTHFQSPIGILQIFADDSSIKEIKFHDAGTIESSERSDILDLCISELKDYFGGSLINFSVPIDPLGTEFMKKVWQHVLSVPFGETSSYGEIAKKCGDIKRSRAVGLANGSNPIPIIIPCHRIIGQNGKLTGYGGGLWRKEWLLRHEARFSGNAELFS